MNYRFRDRAKEWTSWVGIVLSALAVVIPQVLPPDTWWAEAWQSGQLVLGAALIFIPHTAGTTAVENDAWSLLKALSANLPPAYAGPMQPLVQTLAAALAQSTMNPNGPPSGKPQPVIPPGSIIVPAKPVAPPPPSPAPQPQQAAVPPAPVTMPPQPLAADPAMALGPIS